MLGARGSSASSSSSSASSASDLGRLPARTVDVLERSFGKVVAEGRAYFRGCVGASTGRRASGVMPLRVPVEELLRWSLVSMGKWESQERRGGDSCIRSTRFWGDATHLAEISTRVVARRPADNRGIKGRRLCEGGTAIDLLKLLKSEIEEGSIPYRMILVI